MKYLIAYNNVTSDEAGGHFAFCGEEMELDLRSVGGTLNIPRKWK